MQLVFERTVELPVAADKAFAWHSRPGALQRMIPPWDRAQLIQSDGSIRDGSKVIIKVPVLGPFKKQWIAEHFGYQENTQFCDRQVSGPFASFVHTHRFEPLSTTQSRLTDHIEYTPPFGLLGKMGLGLIQSKLQYAFAYRHRVLVSDLNRHARYLDRPRLKIAVTGSSGLVGSVLIPFLTTGGHQVVRLLRRAPSSTIVDGTTSIQWNPDKDEIDAAGLEGVDAVIHLAGEGIAEERWNSARKERILSSRVKSTTLLARMLAKLRRPPQVFFSASAIGYYPPSGDAPLTENDAAGKGFLSEVCVAWEAATKAAEEAGIRTVHGRVGVVMSSQGAALAAQLPLFRWGIAGRLGNGKQYVPWIELGDLVGAIHHTIMNDGIRGPVNLTAPTPVTNYDFTKTLGKVLWRPTILPAPAFALRLALGEMADALLLASLRVLPERLQQAGYAFDYSTLELALRHQLGK